MRLIAFCLIFVCFQAKSQDRTVDSLKSALNNSKDDKVKCEILCMLIELDLDENEWPIYNSQLLSLSEKNSLVKGPNQLTYLKYYADALNNVGFIENNKGNIPGAIINFEKSLKISEEIKDWEGLSNSINNIGAIYLNQGELQKGIEYYKRSIAIQQIINDQQGLAYSLDNIASCYFRLNNEAMALEYHEKSLNIHKEIGNKSGIANALINVAGLYLKSKDSSKVLAYYLEALAIFKELNEMQGIANALSKLGMYYMAKGEYDKALDYSEQSLDIAVKLGYPNNIKEASWLLYSIKKERKDYKGACAHYELYIQMRDSIANDANKKASLRSQINYEYEKKAAADSVKVAEEKKVINAQLKQEKTQRYALYGGLSLLALFAIFMVNRFRITRKQKILIEKQKKIVEQQKHLVEEKQKEILDSIYYARRIQRSLLPNEKFISKLMNRTYR